MGLESFVVGIKASMSKDRAKTVQYLKDYKLKSYFADNVPEDEKKRRESFLERIVDENFKRYEGELGGVARKGTTRGAMGLAMLNDAAAYVSNIPLANVTGLSYALFAAKTAAEIPAMHRYLKKSHDWYGAIGHYLMKPINYLLPIIGGAIEAGAFERMVRKHAGVEASVDFIKEFGDYIPFNERVRSKMKKPLGEAIEMPDKMAA